MSQSNSASPQRRPKGGPHPILRVLGTLFLIGVLTCAMLACLAVMYIKIIILPNAGLRVEDFNTNLSTNMYYTDPATGNNVVMQTLYGEENRVWVEFDEIPQDMKDAAVSIEDRRFHNHNGVDWVRTARGVLSMFTGQKIEGGSTITQQFIKNLTDEDQVTVKRKVTEIFRALEFENNYTKDEILGYYLNYIYLGESCYGVYTASYKYFDKHVSQLSLAECASIIGITNNPSLYNPYGTVRLEDPETGEVKTSRDFNKERQELILWCMLDQKMITQEEYDAAMAEELQFVRGEGESGKTDVYSWYADAVINQVIDDIQENYGYSRQIASGMVYSGGLEIYTCMNPYVQAAVDNIYRDVSNLNHTSSSGQTMQSSMTVVDNNTGAVVAMAGGMGEKEGSLSFNRATRGKRAPGSSIKPLAVYAPALELGVITPFSSEIDSPVEDNWPKNAYNGYYGRMSITRALQISSNTVAVKTLEKVTPEASFQFMQDRFHIDLVESKTVGDRTLTDMVPAALALGGLTEGVNTYEMAAAYSVFPRGGAYIAPRLYSKVVNSDGDVILENTQENESALQQSTAYYMNNMLQTVFEGSGTATRGKFSGMAMAGKTGTTDSRNDLWFVGYTPYYTAAVWTGYDQQERVPSSLNNPSVVLWRQVMQPLHSDLPYQDFFTPESGKLVQVTYCTVSGARANSYCGGNATTTYMLEESAPTSYCTVHTAPVAPPSFNINDQGTWPTGDPNFDPSNPATWPGTSTGGEGAGEGGDGAGGEGTGDGTGGETGTVPPPEGGDAVPPA